jgi:transcriptional regulator with XRE-family HTH domain
MENAIDMKEVGNRLLKLRQSRNLTKKELSEIIGLSIFKISRYEKENQNPSLEELYKFTNYYGVTIRYICGLEE